MNDTTRYGDSVDHDVDLHSIYAAYLYVYASAADQADLTQIPVVCSSHRAQSGGTNHGEDTSLHLETFWNSVGR